MNTIPVSQLTAGAIAAINATVVSQSAFNQMIGLSPTPVFTPRKFYPRSRNQRPIPATQSREFIAAITARMAGHLRPANAHTPTEWIVLTPYSWLRVSLPATMDGDLFTVFTKFEGTKDDLARAVTVVGRDNMNPHSGKWNVHCTDAAAAYEAFCRQLDTISARPPSALADLSFEDYAAPGGPGVAQKIAQYRGEQLALKLRAEEGDLLAKQDYAGRSKPDSITNDIIWRYLRGEIDDAMRYDMSRDWQSHVSNAAIVALL